MKLYRLRLVLHEPSEDTENKYLAEVPDLPGCRAWGGHAAEALENLQSLATAFIESYRDRGDPLPQQVQAAVSEAVNAQILSEILVAV